jgi:hypothetical protein
MELPAQRVRRPHSTPLKNFSKKFFFEKKNQKTFASPEAHRQAGGKALTKP